VTAVVSRLDTWRLKRAGERLRVLREDLHVTDEQLAQLVSDADDLEADAAVDETGRGAVELLKAHEHVEAVERHRRYLLESISAAEAEVDRLLDRRTGH
jgi:hypothetical protein